MEILIDICDGKDVVPAVKAALARLRKSKTAKRLVFAKGCYEFWPDKAEEAYFFPSNNDHGLKRIAFQLSGISDLEIDGQGSSFLFHGKIMPFAIVNASKVSLRGFSIDFKRPFHNEALIVETGDGFVDLKIDKEEFPFEVFNGEILFRHENGELFESRGRCHLLEFDTVKRETAFMVYDIGEWSLRPRAEELPNGMIRLYGSFPEPKPKKGNTFVFGSFRRDLPGIFCAGSSALRFLDVSIHHTGGMGIITQRCEDILLERVSVAPSPNGRRMISTSADATHFVNCKGRLDILGCLFENQMDDPSNVHGIYARITGRTAPDEIEVNLVHRQQAGVEFIAAGDTAEIIDSKTLLPYSGGAVKAVSFINKDYLLVKFEEKLPESIKLGDSIGNATWSADLTIRDCVTRGNRARGFLVSTPGKVLVENNTFHNPGSAILIEGDANFWFEAGAVKDVTIRNNRFENCNYGVWGVATIQVTPGVSKDIAGHVPYHRNIAIRDNLFICFSKRLLYARCVEGISFERNKIETSSEYECLDRDASSITLDGCKGISIKDNVGADAWTATIDGAVAGTLGSSSIQSGI